MLRHRIITIFSLAFVLRLLVLLAFPHATPSAAMSVNLGLVARNIMHGQGIYQPADKFVQQVNQRIKQQGRLIDIADLPESPDKSPTPFVLRMPGYPLFLAGVWKLTGTQRFFPVQLLQVFIDSMAAVLLFFIVCTLLPRPWPLLAGLIYAVHWPAIRSSVFPLPDAWMSFLTFAILLVSLRIVRNPKASWKQGLLLAGTILPAMYMRPNALLLCFVLAIPCLVLLKRVAWRPWVLAIFLCVLGITPWCWRNYQAFDRFIPSTTGMWQAIWECMGEVENPFGAVLDDVKTFEQVRAEGWDVRYGTPEYDDVLKQKALPVLKQHPLWYGKLVLKRLTQAFFMPQFDLALGDYFPASVYAYYHQEHGGTIWDYARQHPFFFILKLAARAWEVLLSVLGLLGIYLARRRWRMQLPAFILLFYYMTTISLVHSIEARYILPAFSLYIIWVVHSLRWAISAAINTATPKIEYA